MLLPVADQTFKCNCEFCTYNWFLDDSAISGVKTKDPDSTPTEIPEPVTIIWLSECPLYWIAPFEPLVVNVNLGIVIGISLFKIPIAIPLSTSFS